MRQAWTNLYEALRHEKRCAQDFISGKGLSHKRRVELRIATNQVAFIADYIQQLELLQVNAHNAALVAIKKAPFTAYQLSDNTVSKTVCYGDLFIPIIGNMATPNLVSHDQFRQGAQIRIRFLHYGGPLRAIQEPDPLPWDTIDFNEFHEVTSRFVESLKEMPREDLKTQFGKHLDDILKLDL